MESILKRYKFYSQEKVLRLSFDNYVMFDKTLDRLISKEFDLHNQHKPLIIVGSWGAPPQESQFLQRNIEMPTISRFSEENPS